MSIATVNLKLEPREFDLIREALSETAKDTQLIVNDTDATPPVRSAARDKVGRLQDLMRKIG